MISQRQYSGDIQIEQKLPHPNAKASRTIPTLRELKRQQQASKEEVDLQKKTEKLIQQMHEQASEGNIPEFGKRIIDVLLNYQGK